MKITTIFALIILSITLCKLQAQNYILPFLHNDKYGVINESGKKILKAEFEAIKVYEKEKVVLGIKESSWELYTLNGKQIIDHKSKASKLDPININVKAWHENTGFTSIRDLNTKNVYFFNLHKLNKKYPVFSFTNNKAGQTIL